MSKEAKFHFMPVHNVDIRKENKTTININKRGIITFSRRYVEENGLRGKYVKFYVDIDKKTLGWQVIGVFNELSDLKKKKEYRKIKTTGSGNSTISLIPILKKINPDGNNYTKLTVDTYVDTLFGKMQYVRLTKRKI